MAHKKENIKLDEQECKCKEECKCKKTLAEDSCNCNENCNCDTKQEKLEKEENLAETYLAMAKNIQADFENYKKRSFESFKQARTEGMIDAIQIILPSLDVFEKAKKMITDENSKKGLDMVEQSIFEGLKQIGVEKIVAKGHMFDPNLHNALSVMEDKNQEDGIILEEYQAGYKIFDKVIKYSQVIVNKIK